MIPGLNLLNLAFTIIAPVPVPYYAYSGRTLNSVRQYISAFKPPVNLTASVQRVARTKYVQYGLDFQRNYIQVYASADMLDLERDSAGDQLIWGGRLYQIESIGTWFIQDGWAAALAVDIGAATTLPFVEP